MNQEQEAQLLLKLIIQSLEKLDNQLAVAGEKNYRAIEDLNEKVNAIHVTMARNTESLEVHMARTIAAEDSLELLKQHLMPIKSTYDGITFTSKLLAKIAAGLVALTTILAGIWEAFKYVMRIP